MWQTDIVNIQTSTEINEFGSIKIEWTDGINVNCDVQDISKEQVAKTYGITDSNEFIQIFDRSLSDLWRVNSQIRIGVKFYLIRLLHEQTKMGGSSHNYIIASRVVV